MQSYKSDLVENIDSEKIVDSNNSEMKQYFDENNETYNIIQNKSSYEFKAPLIGDEDSSQINSLDTTSKLILNSNDQRVKFLYNKESNSEQLEPLIKNCDQVPRFKITQVKDKKKLLDSHENETEYLIDDKGVLIRKNPNNLSESKKPLKDIAQGTHKIFLGTLQKY